MTKRYVKLLMTFSLLLLSRSYSQVIIRSLEPGRSKNASIIGVVVDSLTKAPIESVSFQLLSINDPNKTLGTNTRKDGKFILSNIPLGSYSARISLVGYKKRKRDLLILNEKVRMIDLDTIRLSRKLIVVGEIHVDEKAEPITYEKEKLIVKVTRELGDNGLEVLENTPMVNVDIDGNVSLMGKQSTAIYVDGIPLKQAGYDGAEDLKLLSASDIDKVEIITHPTIEFADTRSDGVINIITKKKSDNLFASELFVGDNTINNLSAGTSLKYNAEPLLLRLNYNYNSSKYNRSSTMLKSITMNNLISNLQQINDNERRGDTHKEMFSVFYNPDKYNTFLAAINYSFRDNNSLQKMQTSQTISSIDSLIDLSSKINTDTKQKFFTTALNYQRGFPASKKKINLSLNYYRNTMLKETESNQQFITPEYTNSIKNDFSDNLNNYFYWKASFSDRLDEKFSYSVGYVGSSTSLTMNNDYFDFDTYNKVFVENIEKKNHYTNSNLKNLITLYLSTNVFGLDFMGGLQYEHYYTSFDEAINNTSFQKKYSNFSPSISVRKSFDNYNGIDFRYSSSYSYPMNKQINPNIDYSDTTNIIMGNPGLEPTASRSLSLGYSYFAESFQIMAGASINKRKNIIESVTSQKNLTTSITTYQNIASSTRYGMSISGSTNVFEFYRVSPWLQWSVSEYEGSVNTNRSSSWSCYLNNSFSFKNLKFQLSVYYSSPRSSFQTEAHADFSADAAVKMLFLDKQLAVSLRVSDLFNTQNLNSNSFSKEFYSTYYNREATRIFSLNISYYFKIKAREEIEVEPQINDYEDDF